MSDAPRITLSQYRERFKAKILELAKSAGFDDDKALEVAIATVEARDIDDLDLMFGDPEGDATDEADLWFEDC